MLRRKHKRIAALALAAFIGLTPMGTQAAAYGYLFGSGNQNTGITAGTTNERVDMTMINEVIQDKNKTQAIVRAEDGAAALATPNEGAREVFDTYLAQVVYVDDVVASEDQVWIKIYIITESGRLVGYLPETDLFYTDQNLAKEVEECREANGIEEPEVLSALDGMRWDIAMFPASYRRKLLNLMRLHPNWSFLPVNVDLDWNTVVYNETIPTYNSAGVPTYKNLVHKSRPASWITGAQPDGWGYASEEVVRHFLDPRNFLNEQDIFMFEQLTLNQSTASIEGLQQYLNNTFMQGTPPAPYNEFPYANIFYQIGCDLGVSPYHLASRVHQEQGAGTSPLISGTYPGYEGYFNYFNIGATGKATQEIIINGLQSAKTRGWNSPFTSIKGGAQVLCTSYILRGQDTLYQQKFDVVIDPNTRSKNFPNLYTHQYMQNIEAPLSEGRKTYQIYAGANALTTGFIFKIPVYKNMPVVPAGEPLAMNDVHAGDWYYDYVSYVYENKIMAGKADGWFAPRDNVTRAEFVTILYNAMGKPAVNYSTPFFDVSPYDWYASSVSWAFANNICSGYGTGYFGPNDCITREQMMQMLYKLAMKEHLDLFVGQRNLDEFSDKAFVSPWAEQALIWGYQFGIMLGKDGRMAPQDYATRAESATIIAKFMRLAD